MDSLVTATLNHREMPTTSKFIHYICCPTNNSNYIKVQFIEKYLMPKRYHEVLSIFQCIQINNIFLKQYCKYEEDTQSVIMFAHLDLKISWKLTIWESRINYGYCKAGI